MKILVVDDEKTLVKGMKFNLENEGYQVECAYDGASAVELERNGKFDLLILDVMMPEMDGLEACMRIREFSNVPIIMLTARSEDTDKIIGFEYGADDYITKPFNILELKARVRARLRRAGATFEDGAVESRHITKADLMDLHLYGPGSTDRRAALIRHLNFPEKMSTNAFLQAVDLLYSAEELAQIMEEIQ